MSRVWHLFSGLLSKWTNERVMGGSFPPCTVLACKSDVNVLNKLTDRTFVLIFHLLGIALKYILAIITSKRRNNAPVHIVHGSCDITTTYIYIMTSLQFTCSTYTAYDPTPVHLYIMTSVCRVDLCNKRSLM